MPGTRADHRRCRDQKSLGGGTTMQPDQTLLAVFIFWFVAAAVSGSQTRYAVVCCAPFAIFLFWLLWLISQNSITDAETIALAGLEFTVTGCVGMITGHYARALIKACLRSQPADQPVPSLAMIRPEQSIRFAPSLVTVRRSARHFEYPDCFVRRAPHARRNHVSRIASVRPLPIEPILQSKLLENRQS